MSEIRELERPELAAWMWKRGYKPADLAVRLNKAPVTVARYLLPFEHPHFRRPGAEDMAIVLDWTSGAITPEMYYPKAIRGRDGTASEAATS